MQRDSPSLTGLLEAWRGGDRAAGNRLFEAAHRELRRLAAWHLRQERPGNTLQATALVNEVYLKLFGGEPVAWRNRAHFLAVAARQMRHLLIDHARARNADKRDGGWVRVSLTAADGIAGPRADDVLELEDALTELEKLDPRAAHVVELRFFGGLTEEEVAEVLHISVPTVKRDWGFARAWLASRLVPDGS